MADKVWVVQYQTFEDVINNTWTLNMRYPDDENGAYLDYDQLKRAFVNVRIGYEVTTMHWEEIS